MFSRIVLCLYYELFLLLFTPWHIYISARPFLLILLMSNLESSACIFYLLWYSMWILLDRLLTWETWDSLSLPYPNFTFRIEYSFRYASFLELREGQKTAWGSWVWVCWSSLKCRGSHSPALDDSSNSYPCSPWDDIPQVSCLPLLGSSSGTWGYKSWELLFS